MDFSRNYISLIENGRNKPSRRFVKALELLEQAPVPHFEHESVVREEYHATPEPMMTGLAIPLLSWAQAGTKEAWDEVQGHEGFVGFNVRDQKAVAVEIRGDGIEPRFPQGTIAIVYPSWKAKSGDLVIALLKDGTVLFKRLHVDGGQFTFISLNPIYPPRTVEKAKVEKLLPVGGTFQDQL